MDRGRGVRARATASALASRCTRASSSTTRETLLRLRAAVGESIGANLDPSHLFWQGIDPVGAIETLGEAICPRPRQGHLVDPLNVARDGVLDLELTPTGRAAAWLFRSVGDGHGPDFWKRFVSALRAPATTMCSRSSTRTPRSIEEGLARAAAVLRQAVAAAAGGRSTWWS